jgi:hypothetical protein
MELRYTTHNKRLSLKDSSYFFLILRRQWHAAHEGCEIEQQHAAYLRPLTVHLISVIPVLLILSVIGSSVIQLVFSILY